MTHADLKHRGKPIGRVVKRLRRDKYLSVLELSSASGVSQQTLYFLERGLVQSPQEKTLLRLVKVFELSFSEFMEEVLKEEVSET